MDTFNGMKIEQRLVKRIKNLNFVLSREISKLKLLPTEIVMWLPEAMGKILQKNKSDFVNVDF